MLAELFAFHSLYQSTIATGAVLYCRSDTRDLPCTLHVLPELYYIHCTDIISTKFH